MFSYRHGISISQACAVEFALIAYASLKFKVIFSRFGICSEKMSLESIFGLEPPSCLGTDAEVSYAELIVCLSPCPPRELVVIKY